MQWGKKKKTALMIMKENMKRLKRTKMKGELRSGERGSGWKDARTQNEKK